MKKTFELKMCAMPNFIVVQVPARQSPDGLQHSSIPITELDAEEAEEYAESMRVAFLEHWKAMKLKNASGVSGH